MQWFAESMLASAIPGGIRRHALRRALRVLFVLAGLLGTGTGATTLAAQTIAATDADTGTATGAAPWSPGPALSARVQAEVATRWAVAPEAVRLEWGAARAGPLPAEDAEFTLIGSGAGGSWIVAFTLPRTTTPATTPALRLWLRAGVEVREPVAARDLERDLVLGPDDITTAATVRWGGAPETSSAVTTGWVTRRQLRAGEVLREPAVGPPLAVRTGENVQAIWRRGGVELTLRARALGSAVIGARVTVRTESGRRFEGIAMGESLVEIDTPPEVKS